jgi:hypothetical protein
VSASLPSPSEPLRLADGSLVYPGGRVTTAGDSSASPPVGFVEIPTHREAQRVIAGTRRKLADLPEVPKTMNAVGAILAYTLFGMDDEEIAIATKLTIEQIGRLKMGDAYSQMHEAIVRTIVDSETDVVRDMLAKNARNAAATMVEALQAGNRSDRMAAARDILDRSGHRPADIIEHRHRVDGGLVIEYIKRGSEEVPVIDMERMI